MWSVGADPFSQVEVRMRKVRTSIALAVAILVVGSAPGCGTDPAGPGSGPGPVDGSGPVGGPGPAVLTRLEVTPATADLCTQGDSVQLTLVPRDQDGAQIRTGAGTATYSSSAPDIASVNTDGVVAAAAPGKAVITATFTFGDSTRAASMQATVHQAPVEYPRIAGVYDVTAVITASFWGPPGERETAVLTIDP